MMTAACPAHALHPAASAGYPCERIDGSTSSRDRQAAIDRYSKKDSDGFVFLLSTRAVSTASWGRLLHAQ